MFCNKKKTCGLPLGLILGSVAGMAIAAVAVSCNTNIRKTLNKEASKLRKKALEVFNTSYFGNR